jgi:hypothetical protein
MIDMQWRLGITYPIRWMVPTAGDLEPREHRISIDRRRSATPHMQRDGASVEMSTYGPSADRDLRMLQNHLLRFR